MVWQFLATLMLILIAMAIVAMRLRKIFSRGATDSCGSCGGCSGKKSSPQLQVTPLIKLGGVLNETASRGNSAQKMA